MGENRQTGVDISGERDWASITNPAERRRQQNRINQKLYRQRMASIGRKIKAKSPASQQTIKPTSRSQAAKSDSGRSVPHALEINHRPPDVISRIQSGAEPLKLGIRLKKTPPLKIAEDMTLVEAQAYYQLSIGSPRVDQLFTLIQFNVLRAFFSNTAALGFGLEWLLPDSESPFSAGGVGEFSNIAARDLRPSVLQKTISHHPWIDMLPVPNMRDNLLRAEGIYDEDDLCNDLVDFDGIANEKTGLIVWGQPWEASGWEVSETFHHKWPWVLRDCEELYVATNHWRDLRGEEPLMPPRVDS